MDTNHVKFITETSVFRLLICLPCVCRKNKTVNNFFLIKSSHHDSPLIESIAYYLNICFLTEMYLLTKFVLLSLKSYCHYIHVVNPLLSLLQHQHIGLHLCRNVNPSLVTKRTEVKEIFLPTYSR